MIKKLLFTCLIGVISLSAAAQEVLEIPDDGNKKVLSRRYEFSSVAFVGDNMLLFSERCHRLVECVIHDGKTIAETHDRSAPAQFAEIEGIALYGKWYLLADENCSNSSDGRPFTIWQYTPGEPPYSVRILDLHVDNYDNLHGIEGIAVNKQDSLCYLLQERDGKGHSVIYVLGLSVRNGRVHLTYKDHMQFSQEGDGRFSDIYYEPASRKLLCLKSYLDAHRYGIARISVDKTGNPVRESMMQPVVYDISGFVSGYPDEMNNIEGLAVRGEYVYIVSDNGDRSGNGCKGTQFPLMFRLQIEKVLQAK